MNLTYIFLIALPLAITLIVAAVLDIKYREVHAWVWIPAAILGGIGVSFGAYAPDEFWLHCLLINLGVCVLVMFAACANQVLLTIKKADKIYFGFADALCIFLISMLKPVTLGFPTILILGLISGSVLCLGYLIPGIQKRWEESCPFMVPLALGGMACLLL